MFSSSVDTTEERKDVEGADVWSGTSDAVAVGDGMEVEVKLPSVDERLSRESKRETSVKLTEEDEDVLSTDTSIGMLVIVTPYDILVFSVNMLVSNRVLSRNVDVKVICIDAASLTDGDATMTGMLGIKETLEGCRVED